MLFNSYVFLFIFLPIVFVGYYYVLGKADMKTKFLWLLASSLFFYGYWNPKYLVLILGSMVVNYGISKVMNHSPDQKRIWLVLGILFNLSLLGYYKYTNFFIDNLNTLFHTNIVIEKIMLPLAISFFTFQQIAFIVDSYQGAMKQYNFVEYCLFVTFFPQLIAGPIVHHEEMMPQFKEENTKIQFNHITTGIYILMLGMFKKVLIADNLAITANAGYGAEQALTLVESWITSLSYTMQLYFDFSGYCDMAIGVGLLFNIRLPINFDSPYKSLNITEFWRRWHITLSRFLTHYIYIPLGGNRKGSFMTYRNIFIVFFLSGLWHGAGWTFIIWGVLHGLASIVYRLWKNTNLIMPKWLAWFLTFQFVNMAWVFFRAADVGQALSIMKGMLGLNGIVLPPEIANGLNQWAGMPLVPMASSLVFNSQQVIEYTISLLVLIFIVLLWKNSIEKMETFKPSLRQALFLSIITIITILSLTKVSEFLYFNF